VCPPPENPYTDTSEQFFDVQPFLVNWPQGGANATQDESLLFTDPTVVSLGSGQGTGPITPYYGLNFTVTRPK
jgi:hypothetical protein